MNSELALGPVIDWAKINSFDLPPNPMQFTVFARAGRFNGDLRGTNENCQAEAMQAQLPGTYVPFLHPILSVINDNAPLVNIKVGVQHTL